MQESRHHTTKARPWVATAATWAIWILAAYLLVAAAVGILAG